MGHVPSHFPNGLKKYRRIMGYSQKEVAKILGFKSTSRISRWEKGESIPSVKNLLRLSILYATLPNELYFEWWKELRDRIKKDKGIIEIKDN